LEFQDGWITQQDQQTFFFFRSSLCKTLIRICFVSIVKKRHILLLTFDPTKKIKKRKEKKEKKIKIQEDIHEESLEDCSSWW